MQVERYMPPLAGGWGGEQGGTEVLSLPQPEPPADDPDPLLPDTRDKGLVPPRPGLDLGAATELPALSAEQHAWLEPRRGQLPPSPRAQTDFTAYSLEWGEARVGLMNASVGVLPRAQVGTVPVLWPLGMVNVNGKVNAIRIGPLDAGVTGRYNRLVHDWFGTIWTGGGAIASVIVVPAWSVHGGISYDRVHAEGVPDPDRVPLLSYFGDELNAVRQTAQATGFVPDLTANYLSVRAATDLRFNRLDSVIVQASAVVWGGVDANFEVPDLTGFPIGETESQWRSLTDSYVASVAIQRSWRQVDVRFGVGVSSFPGAWLLQATELAGRFGGPTRKEEGRMQRAWRKNRDEVEGQE